MTRIRVFIFILTIIVVGVFGTIASYYARGYRFDNTGNLAPSGLMVVNSTPLGAQIYVNGELKSATNATIGLAPAIYDVNLKKEGYITWNKRITIEKEVVTQIDAKLFPSAPSISSITFSGAGKPIVSPDGTKIAYSTPADSEKPGLWILETVNLPLGFNRDPRIITDGNLDGASWTWSPDSRQILLTTKSGVFLLDASAFTPQNQRVNITSTLAKTQADWAQKAQTKIDSQLARLPDELISVFDRKAKDIVFSPDENKILYTASDSATIPSGLIKPLPGSSTQHEERNIKKDHKYVFDVKEDRNFEVVDTLKQVYWFANSLNLIVPEPDHVVIMDYDGTNKQTVYAGPYEFPYALPTPNLDRIFILTNLGAKTTPLNLYSLNLK